MTFSNTETQGIFLHIECVPFWDAAPFHWDAAAPNFRSLRPKRKMLLIHIKIKLKINEIMQKKQTAYPPSRLVLSCPPPCFTLPCSTSRAVMLNLPDTMPHLPQCLALPCPELPYLALLCPALPCPAVLCSALPFRATSFHTLPCSVLPCPALRCIA